MSAYFVANYTVTNEDGYRRYLDEVGETLRAHGAQVLVADYASDTAEGSPAPVTVVLRFDSKEAAREWYNSSDYQAVVHHRLDNTEGFAVFCDEYRRSEES
ncbi:MAG: DUF1330 domain-containing protein [Actinomycetota bacterium]|nr:DUF1330 domain-containing protein [Actinomycetota bacterium]